MLGKAGTVVQRKKLPKKTWLQMLMYRANASINQKLNIVPMRSSRFKYALRLIIGIIVWIFKSIWRLIKFLNFGISIKKGKTKASKTYLITVQGYAITLAIKKMKPKP